MLLCGHVWEHVWDQYAYGKRRCTKCGQVEWLFYRKFGDVRLEWCEMYARTKNPRLRDLRLIGHAVSLDWRAWRCGWAVPMMTPDVPAGPVDGDWWLCCGPLCLMFEYK